MKQKPIVRFFPLLLLISLIFGCISLISSISSTIKRQNAREDREKILVELQKREAALQKKLEFTRSPEFIESEARMKLNMARPGETIILINQELGNGETLKKTSATTNWKIWWGLFY
ncbi:MAG: septum formation initiator family protein [Microgenomates group bacterium]